MPSYLLLMQRSWCLFNQNFVFRRKKVEHFRRYKLAIQITNSPILNKLQLYSRISAVGPEGHCTSRFKRAMCISCRPHVDVHEGEGAQLLWTHVDRGGRVKNRIFCGRHKWMTQRPKVYEIGGICKNGGEIRNFPK